MTSTAPSSRFLVSLGPAHKDWRNLARTKGVPPSTLLAVLAKAYLAKNRVERSQPLSTGINPEQWEPLRSIQIRLRPSEIEALDLMAQANYVSRRELIVRLLREGVTGAPWIPPQACQNLKEIAYELNKIGININQQTRLLNELRKTGLGNLIKPNVEEKKLEHAKLFIENQTRRIWDQILKNEGRESIQVVKPRLVTGFEDRK